MKARHRRPQVKGFLPSQVSGPLVLAHQIRDLAARGMGRLWEHRPRSALLKAGQREQRPVGRQGQGHRPDRSAERLLRGGSPVFCFNHE